MNPIEAVVRAAQIPDGLHLIPLAIVGNAKRSKTVRRGKDAGGDEIVPATVTLAIPDDLAKTINAEKKAGQDGQSAWLFFRIPPDVMDEIESGVERPRKSGLILPPGVE